VPQILEVLKLTIFFKKNVGGGVSDLWYTLKGLGVHYEVEFYCHKLLSNVHTRVLVMTFSDNVTLGLQLVCRIFMVAFSNVVQLQMERMAYTPKALKIEVL